MIENVVRPFQNTTPIVSRGVVSTRLRVQREKARLVWGDAGTMPTPQKELTDPAGFSFKVEDCKQGQQEQSRTYYDVQRIPIRDKNGTIIDPGNYLEWQAIKQIAFKPADNGVNKASGFLQIQWTDYAPTGDFSNDFEKAYKCNASTSTYNLKQPPTPAT